MRKSLDVFRSVAQEAFHLVNRGSRQKDYGDPLAPAIIAGRMIGAILHIPDVSPTRVPLIVMALKIVRETFQAKRDNRVDIAGYAEVLERIHHELAKKTLVGRSSRRIRATHRVRK